MTIKNQIFCPVCGERPPYYERRIHILQNGDIVEEHICDCNLLYEETTFLLQDQTGEESIEERWAYING